MSSQMAGGKKGVWRCCGMVAFGQAGAVCVHMAGSRRPEAPAYTPTSPSPCSHSENCKNLPFLFPCFGGWQRQTRSLQPPAVLEGTAGACNTPPPHRGWHLGAVHPPNGASPHGRGPKASRAELAAQEEKMHAVSYRTAKQCQRVRDARALQPGDIQLLQQDPGGTGGEVGIWRGKWGRRWGGLWGKQCTPFPM